ncbi:MAG: UDP-N-acetylmuramate--L-alanine ligase [Bernardetiaceae bacterium]
MLQEISCVYFLGIGGVGMSALAHWFLVNGYSVAGYDRSRSDITARLQVFGAEIHYVDDPSVIPSDFLHPQKTLVVYTPAIPSDHQELNYLVSNGFHVRKRAEVLGYITRHSSVLAIAGTHGKTTTAALLTHILHTAGVSVTAFVGGVMNNYAGTFVPASPDSEGMTSWAIVEADEFDRSFLRLQPQHIILTSVEADHLDIYGTPDAVREAFSDFLDQRQAGYLIAGPSVPAQLLEGRMQLIRYGDKQAYTFSNIKIVGTKLVFDWHLGDHYLPSVCSSLAGRHNLENATAAATLALQLGVSPEQIRAAMESYDGVKRRFEILLNTPEIALVDDYAHHPTEVRAAIAAARMLFPNRRLTVVFQPHLYTRTRDFYEGFAESLSDADEVILLDIYPAREQPIAGIDSGIILSNLKSLHKIWLPDQDFLPYASLHGINWEVVLTLGAGSIDRWLDPLKQLLTPTSPNKP